MTQLNTPVELHSGQAVKRPAKPEPHEVIDRFRDAIASAGLPAPAHIEADGQLHRFTTNGKASDKAGYYCLHLDGLAAGHFGCWREGIRQNWSARNGARLDRAELDRLRESIEQAKAEREQRQKARAQVARDIWDAAQPAQDSHPYLMRKGVRVAGEIRQADIDRAAFFDDPAKRGTMRGCLLVKVEGPEGLQSLQAITPEGDSKPFMSGGKIAGGCTILPGDASTVYVVEGLATGLTVHHATGATVAVAFNSGNLAATTRRIGDSYPRAFLVIAGDNDHRTEGNPGKVAAEKAAQASGAAVALPSFEPDEPGTDWNDIHATRGLDAVREALQAKRKPAFEYTMVGDLVTHLKPIDWIVKDYIEADSLGLIYGPPKCGKSFLAIDWACSIATGTAWHGRKVQQGAVFYLAGEGHNGLARRFASWSLSHGVSLKDAPLAISNRAAPLTDEDSARKVAQAIEHLAEIHGAPAVIVVDTLARNFGADENSTQDMNTFVQHLDEIRANWKCTVLVVHHTGKDKSRGARGSVALTGAIDAGYSVDRDELGMINMEPTEMKDAELPKPLFFKLESVKLPMVDEDGNDVFGAHLSPGQADYQPPQRGKAGRGRNQTLALAKLESLYQEQGDRLHDGGRDPEEARVLVTDWRTACIDGGIKPNRWPDVRRTLEDAGLVEINHPYAYRKG